ncbi:hypothetical protein BDN70DRAFT_929841 [Pholiota conissans]|uniref:Uncharacterized protein n=1 Tax=Pholiota conissans TaxID=109636 RepID=A0A9P5Z852_9AGAR|nr:hypothetical protein BDN70DRAFT_929841 [Pholiota conissans]
MSLTHLGLRVRLLVAHAQFIDYTNAQPNEKRGPFDINLKLRLPMAPFADLTILLNKRYSEVPKLPLCRPPRFAYFVGLYTFKEAANKDTIEIPFYSPIFIIQIPVRSPVFTIDDLTAEHFEPAVKVDTRSVHWVTRLSDISFVTSPGSGDARIIKKDHLKGVGMKLLNVR